MRLQLKYTITFRKFICLFLFVSSLQKLSAQDNIWGGNGIYLSLGKMNNGRIQGASVASFLDSYNQKFASTLTKKFDPLVFDNNFGWGIGAYFTGIDVEIMFSDLSYTNTAVFQDGRIREVSLNTSQFIGDVGFLIPMDIFKVGAYVIMSTQTGYLSSKMIYPSGEFSYGIESPYNGVFTIDHLDIGYGFKAMTGLKYVFFTFQAQRMGDFMPWLDDGIDTPPAMKDQLGIGGDSKFFTNYTYPTFLSENAGSVPINSSTISQGLVNPALNNWRFFLSITFCLSNHRD